MKKLQAAIIAIAGLMTITSCDKKDDVVYEPAPPVHQAFRVTGDSASIVSQLDAFRNVLGATLNTAPGATGGRREINWDAVPPTFTNNNNFPADFFGQSDPALPNGRKRGFVMEPISGTQFRVDSTSFVDIASSYGAQFVRFSPKRLFMTIGTNISIASFRVPGTTTNAYVKGFGVIFSDVDQDKTASIEFFDGDKSLGVYYASKSAGTSQNFSFLGIYFPNDKVTKVKITSGQGGLANSVFDVTSGGTLDLVTMDDFLYDEPKAIQ